MSARLAEITSCLKPEQRRNAPPRIDVTLEGITSPVRPQQQ
jgi:hypothetical protein